MSVYGAYCVFSDSGLCDGPISRPEESYRVCVCVCVCVCMCVCGRERESVLPTTRTVSR